MHQNTCSMWSNRRLLLPAAVTLFAGCAPVKDTRPLPGTELPTDLPSQCTATTDATTGTIHDIDAQRSSIRIAVFRDGQLSRLGHNHIVMSRELYGFVMEESDFEQSSFALCIPVNQLIVDDPSARAEAGPAFATQLDESLVAATRRNMLDENQLAGERYPYVVITGRISRTHPESLRIAMLIQVRDHRYATDASAVFHRAEGGATTEGKLQLKLSDIGIQPYSALFGALRVRDELELTYRLTTARRVAAAPGALVQNSHHHKQEHLTP